MSLLTLIYPNCSETSPLMETAILHCPCWLEKNPSQIIIPCCNLGLSFLTLLGNNFVTWLASYFTAAFTAFSLLKLNFHKFSLTISIFPHKPRFLYFQWDFFVTLLWILSQFTLKFTQAEYPEQTYQWPREELLHITCLPFSQQHHVFDHIQLTVWLFWVRSAA